MSAVKRHIENEIDRIARKSGYSWNELMGVYMEAMEDDGYVDMQLFEQISMEHDW